VIRRAPGFRKRAALGVLFLLLGGCGGAGGEEGTATLWVTRDRGAELLVDVEVDAGQTLMRALAAEADVETRYGGRYVQSVNGIEGDLGEQSDWFWFLNGYEGDRSAAAYTLRDGDIAWVDYRAWEREGEARVVVGAFPEPLLHGYDGRTRPLAIRYEPAVARRASALARELGRADVQAFPAPVPEGSNVLEVRAGAPRLTGELLGQTAGDPVRFVLSGFPAYERRYSVP
jgi:hypothetical protein